MNDPRLADGQRRESRVLRPSQVLQHSLWRNGCRPLLLAFLVSALLGCRPAGKEELYSKSDERYLPQVGKPSPPLKFKALDGREVDLEKLRGKVVLLDFWATWCPPCLEELPRVREAYERYHKDGFEIVGISFDTEKQRLEEVVQRERLPWPQYFDGAGRDAAPGKTFGVKHWPSTWLLDRNGVIRYISAGAGLDRKITALLKESANPITAARGVLEQKAAAGQDGSTAAPGSPVANPAQSTNASTAVTEAKLGDHAMRVKSISVGANRSTALLQIGPANYTISPGTELVFTSGGVQRNAQCTEVTRDTVVLKIEGSAEPLRLRLP